MTKLRIYNQLESPLLELETDLPLEISELLGDANITYKKTDLVSSVLTANDTSALEKLFSKLKTEVALNKLNN